MYDPTISRWNGIDIKVDKFVTVSPYNYALNNPIIFVDPDGQEVKPANEAALRMITNTLTAEDAAFVQLDDNGMINRELINMRKSESSTFQALQTLVNDERTTHIRISDNFSSKDSEGNINTEKIKPIDYRSEFELMIELSGFTKEQAEKQGFSKEREGSGLFGITILPGGEKDGDGRGSINGDIIVIMNVGSTDKDKARFTAHEAFGHVLFFLLGKDPNHGGNDNDELTAQILKLMEEAAKNYDEQNDDKN
jgi:hypothetical protein